jgi:prepilin-type processing-associated H-X9-DG protein
MHRQTGFSLVELLVVIGIVIILMGLLFPVMRKMHASGQRAFCANNLRQLYRANIMYADENGGFVPAASDMWGSENNHRWHGSRESGNDPFDDSKGPLSPYLGKDGRITHCPAFSGAVKSTSKHAFESNCGGYGYNVGVGSLISILGNGSQAMKEGMNPADLQHPANTVMFADCALSQPYGSKPKYLIEYSFAEPYYHFGTRSQPYPSIHFRHNGLANVVWCDGHVSSEKMTHSSAKHFKKFNLGWFGPADNSLFVP